MALEATGEQPPARIAADGVMVKGQRGQRAHPLLKIEATLRGFVVRSLGKLGIAT